MLHPDLFSVSSSGRRLARAAMLCVQMVTDMQRSSRRDSPRTSSGNSRPVTPVGGGRGGEGRGGV